MKSKKTADENKKKILSKKSANAIKIVVIVVLIGIAVPGLIVLGRYAAARIQMKSLTAADMKQAGKTYNGVKAIGMVNGEPFFQSDLDVYSQELRAAVAAYYGKKYNLSGMGADFWNTKFDGQTPKEFQEKIALKDLVKNIVIIQEARKRGIDAPAAFHDLEDERETWNAPTDDIVYGPKTLAPAEYNSYRLTGITDNLKTELLKKELAPTLKQLKASYKSLDDGLKIAPRLTSGIRFFWDGNAAGSSVLPAAGNISPDKLSNDEIRSAIQKGITDGLTPEALVEKLSAAVPGLAQEEFNTNSRYVSKEDTYEQGLANTLGSTPVGSFASGPEDRPEFFYVTKNEGGYVMPFEEAPGLGRNKWINDQFEIFINTKIKEARITLFPVTPL